MFIILLWVIRYWWTVICSFLHNTWRIGGAPVGRHLFSFGSVNLIANRLTEMFSVNRLKVNIPSLDKFVERAFPPCGAKIIPFWRKTRLRLTRLVLWLQERSYCSELHNLWPKRAWHEAMALLRYVVGLVLVEVRNCCYTNQLRILHGFVFCGSMLKGIQTAFKIPAQLTVLVCQSSALDG